MMEIANRLKEKDLQPLLDRFFELSARKIAALDKAWDPAKGSPVFTVKGKYTSRGWTEWTQGFQFGCQILQFDATGDEKFLEMGRRRTLDFMAPHVSHTGVHDHGFNNISTYGNLRRLVLEGRVEGDADTLNFYEMALKVSGAVQAARWSVVADGTGYIHSFNGPHSLFSDTVRSCRVLVLAHKLGHVLMGENDRKISLLQRAVEHIANTSRYNVYFGKERDAYDIPGRVVHESIFNMTDGNYRCPSTQQGYSPFSTWTRGLAWIVTGFAEQLEAFQTLADADLKPMGGRAKLEAMMLATARATADFYIANTPTDGVPYWDTGAPGLAAMPDCLDRKSEPDNPHEPIDSSAAAIAAQGLLRLGKYLGKSKTGRKYWKAGLSVARSIFQPPYLSESTRHQGLILHSVYHRPNGWDYVPKGKKVPSGEASMWGDYHAMELALYLKREIEGGPYPTFWGRPD